MDLEVESTDVIRILLQYLKENKLDQTFRTLQNETQVSLNSMSEPNQLVSAIRHGKWDEVLEMIQDLRLPYSKLANLYEQIIFELLELREIESISAILHEGKLDEPLDPNDQGMSSVLITMRKNNPNRFYRMERLLNQPHFERDQVYVAGTSKEKRRIQIAQEIVDELQTAPPSRLMSLLTQALRYQQIQGVLPEGQQYDLFREISPENLQPELFPTRMHGQIKFGKKSYPMCCGFSPDGQFLVSGSVDGFIEVWNFATCKLQKDLSYQASDNFMIHRTSVLCLDFSADGRLLASGDKEGSIKVWELSTGKCIQKFSKVHQKSITGLQFSKQATKILSCSQDGTVRIHGRQSGQTLNTFRGHGSFVNDCCWAHDELHVISCSSDGTVRVWNIAQGDAVHNFRPGNGPMYEATVNNICLHPLKNEIFVCNRSMEINLFSYDGQLIRKFSKTEGRDFVRCGCSPKGLWVYGISEDGLLSSFDELTGEMKNSLLAHDREPTGFAVHPHRNFVATFTEGILLKLWKPSASQRAAAKQAQQLQDESSTTTSATTGVASSKPKIQFSIKK